MSVVSCLRKSKRAIEIYISEKNKLTQNQTKTQQNKNKQKSQNKTKTKKKNDMSLAEKLKIYFAWHKNRLVLGDVQNMI